MRGGGEEDENGRRSGVILARGEGRGGFQTSHLSYSGCVFVGMTQKLCLIDTVSSSSFWQLIVIDVGANKKKTPQRFHWQLKCLKQLLLAGACVHVGLLCRIRCRQEPNHLLCSLGRPAQSWGQLVAPCRLILT